MKNKYYLISIISFLIFILVYIFLRIGIIILFDDTVYTFFKINNLNTAIMLFVTLLGDPKTMFYITILLLLFLKNKRVKIIIALNYLIGLNIFRFIKALVKRPRPDGINIIKISGYSFPSGHTYMTIVFYGLLFYLINKNNERSIFRSLLNIFLILLIVLVPISRIYLGVHYASDTFAGFALGLIQLLLIVNMIEKKEATINRQ